MPELIPYHHQINNGAAQNIQANQRPRLASIDQSEAREPLTWTYPSPDTRWAPVLSATEAKIYFTPLVHFNIINSRLNLPPTC